MEKTENRRLLELFCGTKSISKEFERLGWGTTTLDIDPQFKPDIVADILTLQASDFEYYDVIWASPPCETFSVAQIGHNWYHNHTPKTEKAERGLQILRKTVEIIKELDPKFYFIENPVGKMRRLLDLPRKTVTYCQYGDFRQKPTDIWTNSDWAPRPMCPRGGSCHVPAPRGSKTGTQGMKNAVVKAIIPSELCKEVAQYCNEHTNT